MAVERAIHERGKLDKTEITVITIRIAPLSRFGEIQQRLPLVCCAAIESERWYLVGYHVFAMCKNRGVKVI